jgi:hypothetical protein
LFLLASIGREIGGIAPIGVPSVRSISICRSVACALDSRGMVANATLNNAIALLMSTEVFVVIAAPASV